ncbi:peptidoglycan DD-metalloendopeptidase family protein [Patescibacteria group bacterium]|nr:peptidoglycan DD-metalloendopeptidase family protein [Patescibacteria group bacterium]
MSVVLKSLSFILRPFQRLTNFILSIFFYKFIVKVYKVYVTLINKLGWAHFKKKSLLFVFSQKPLHVTVAILTIVLVFNNAIAKTQAETHSVDINKTILAELINSEFGGIEEEQLIEEFFDQESVISSLQQSYLENLTQVEIQPMVDVSKLTSDGEDEDLIGDIVQGSSDGEQIDKNEQDNKNVATRTETINYTVKPGDTISTIAHNFGISVSTILWENDLNAYSIIRPGNILQILPKTGISYKITNGDTLSRIAQLYNIDEEDIMTANGMDNANKLSLGQKIIIPNGEKRYVTKTSSPYSGIQAIRDIVKPSNSKVKPGVKMLWPTACHRITQYYSSRHTGLDIACSLGTPLYAADAGVVEYAGWGKGYGNQVVIDHGGGKKTRYAHASKLYVRKGQRVSKGEAVAAMGSTGWSTGSHIHFEVIINGVRYNPLSYIK